MKYLLILITLSIFQQQAMQGIDSKDKSITITLDELTTQEISERIWDNKELNQLTIQKTKSKTKWSTYPPLSWYETVKFVPPYWVLSSKIGRLKNLKSLVLVDLDIQTLPDAITELQQLEELYLSFNKLEVSDELWKFKELKNLKRLVLYGNHYDLKEMQNYQRLFPELLIEYKSQDNQ